jgi:hypothetical protein
MAVVEIPPNLMSWGWLLLWWGWWRGRVTGFVLPFFCSINLNSYVKCSIQVCKYVKFTKFK